MKNELVEVRNGKVVCNSLMVAEKFGKNHFDVLRDIKNLECSQEFRAVKDGKVVCNTIECVVKATMTAAGNLDTAGVQDGIRVIESLGLGVNTVIAITEMIFRHYRACIIEHNQANNKEGNVYFLKSLSTGLIKIGKTTKKVKARVSQMRGMCAGDVEILGYISETYDNTETMLHKKFKHLRVNGEWFSPGEDLLAYIDSIPKQL